MDEREHFQHHVDSRSGLDHEIEKLVRVDRFCGVRRDGGVGCGHESVYLWGRGETGTILRLHADGDLENQFVDGCG
jgi:hypothetical protein